jgi:hypothetical protein
MELEQQQRNVAPLTVCKKTQSMRSLLEEDARAALNVLALVTVQDESMREVTKEPTEIENDSSAAAFMLHPFNCKRAPQRSVTFAWSSPCLEDLLQHKGGLRTCLKKV